MRNRKAILHTYKSLSLRCCIAISLIFVLSSSYTQSITQDAPFKVITLQDAIDSCKTNHPILLNAQINIDIIESGKKGIKYKPIEFYQKTEQISPFPINYNFDINNNSISPFLSFNKKAIIEKELDLTKDQLKIMTTQFIGIVKSSYNYWVYCQNKLSILNELKNGYNDLLRVTELHYKHGESNMLEKSSAEVHFADIQYKYKMALSDVLIAENNLKMLIMSEADIKPEKKNLSMYVIKPSDNEYTRFSGDLLIGYYIKKCDLEDTRSKKDNLNKKKANNELNFQKHFITKRIDVLTNELNKCLLHLTYYDGSALPYAEKLIETTNIKFQKEDITYLEWLQNMDKAIKIKLEHLDALNEYNQTAIKLELYCY